MGRLGVKFGPENRYIKSPGLIYRFPFHVYLHFGTHLGARIDPQWPHMGRLGVKFGPENRYIKNPGLIYRFVRTFWVPFGTHLGAGKHMLHSLVA